MKKYIIGLFFILYPSYNTQAEYLNKDNCPIYAFLATAVPIYTIPTAALPLGGFSNYNYGKSWVYGTGLGVGLGLFGALLAGCPDNGAIWGIFTITGMFIGHYMGHNEITIFGSTDKEKNFLLGLKIDI